MHVRIDQSSTVYDNGPADCSFVHQHSVLWGLMELCLAFPHSFGPFGAVRFLLGFAEGAVSPAFVVITSQWCMSVDDKGVQVLTVCR